MYEWHLETEISVTLIVASGPLPNVIYLLTFILITWITLDVLLEILSSIKYEGYSFNSNSGRS